MSLRAETGAIPGAVIQIIPQGTVNKNLGSYRLAGPKALDPN